jgi:hypothetical protein
MQTRFSPVFEYLHEFGDFKISIDLWIIIFL